MVIFHSYVSLPEGIIYWTWPILRLDFAIKIDPIQFNVFFVGRRSSWKQSVPESDERNIDTKSLHCLKWNQSFLQKSPTNQPMNKAIWISLASLDWFTGKSSGNHHTFHWTRISCTLDFPFESNEDLLKPGAGALWQFTAGLAAAVPWCKVICSPVLYTWPHYD